MLESASELHLLNILMGGREGETIITTMMMTTMMKCGGVKWLQPLQRNVFIIVSHACDFEPNQ